MSAVTSSMFDIPRTIFAIENQNNAGGNQTGQCKPMPPPSLGTLKLVHGNGTSVGTIISFQCPSKHRLIGEGTVTCVWRSSSSQWTGGAPWCKPLTRFEDFGFRVAVIASIVSCVVILLMSMAFLTCCLLKCIKRQERQRRERETHLWVGQGHLGETQAPHKGRNKKNNRSKQKTTSSLTCDCVECNKRMSYGCHHLLAMDSLAFTPAPFPCSAYSNPVGPHPECIAPTKSCSPAEQTISVISRPYMDDPNGNCQRLLNPERQPSQLIYV
ncbi:sushi domain-containing protein 3 isoform X1 [Brienomyrus brachyistius]|uniref:sushi domain-containing protein 3 isoform X1 n=1 Tax=Brienomyrus brachyistius TaxID=42636 RepID=UPI0020B1F5E0|nr:sushi domain-containing protein 3 isoform X1 [Brienomyrus brachyistius]